jgi:tetratricopeptide (TPR) repeat protein
MPGFYLIPRLIAHDVYRHALPPDPWVDVLRADLRFVVRDRSVNLAEKLVNTLEREWEAPGSREAGPMGPAPRPRGDRRRARSDEARRAWGRYLFDRGMECLWAGWIPEALACYQETLRVDPGHADAWVHIGNRRFEEGWTVEALNFYQRGQAAAEERTIGDPDCYRGVFWGDLRSRPYMRALHGQGLCFYRLGRRDEARRVYARMLELNPNDNQGVRFLIKDLDEGLSWEESVKREDERFP